MAGQSSRANLLKFLLGWTATEIEVNDVTIVLFGFMDVDLREYATFWFLAKSVPFVSLSDKMTPPSDVGDKFMHRMCMDESGDLENLKKAMNDVVTFLFQQYEAGEKTLFVCCDWGCSQGPCAAAAVLYRIAGDSTNLKDIFKLVLQRRSSAWETLAKTTRVKNFITTHGIKQDDKWTVVLWWALLQEWAPIVAAFQHIDCKTLFDTVNEARCAVNKECDGGNLPLKPDLFDVSVMDPECGKRGAGAGAGAGERRCTRKRA